MPRQRVRAAKSRPGLVLRTIATKIPTLDELGMPAVLRDIGMSKRGLVIFVGGTGTGKDPHRSPPWSGLRNEHSYGHIITVEDPIEYVHSHKNCIVTQREIGIDTDDREAALKNTPASGPRCDPHGEKSKRPQTMDYAVAFAETGPPPASAPLHANSANQAIDRLSTFSPEERRTKGLMDLPQPAGTMICSVCCQWSAARAGSRRSVMLNCRSLQIRIFKGEISEIKEPSDRRAPACRLLTRRFSTSTRPI